MFTRLILPLYRSEVSDVKPLISASVFRVLRGAAFAAGFAAELVFAVAGLVEAAGLVLVDGSAILVESACVVPVVGVLSGCTSARHGISRQAQRRTERSAFNEVHQLLCH